MLSEKEQAYKDTIERLNKENKALKKEVGENKVLFTELLRVKEERDMYKRNFEIITTHKLEDILNDLYRYYEFYKDNSKKEVDKK